MGKTNVEVSDDVAHSEEKIVHISSGCLILFIFVRHLACRWACKNVILERHPERIKCMAEQVRPC